MFWLCKTGLSAVFYILEEKRNISNYLKTFRKNWKFRVMRRNREWFSLEDILLWKIL